MCLCIKQYFINRQQFQIKADKFCQSNFFVLFLFTNKIYHWVIGMKKELFKVHFIFDEVHLSRITHYQDQW